MNTAELLEHPVLSINETCRVLKLTSRDGKPNRRALHALIRSGALRVIDPTQVIHRWTISSVEVRRYIESGPANGTTT